MRRPSQIGLDAGAERLGRRRFPVHDERLRRLEASVVSSDRVLQLQAESLMVAAAHRAERTAAWGVLALSAAVLAYTFWPSNKQRFDRAADAILHDEDKPCR